MTTNNHDTIKIALQYLLNAIVDNDPEAVRQALAAHKALKAMQDELAAANETIGNLRQARASDQMDMARDYQMFTEELAAANAWQDVQPGQYGQWGIYLNGIICIIDETDTDYINVLLPSNWRLQQRVAGAQGVTSDYLR